ncbi:unnamed protein product [Cylicocyclus nassatus]|uniref:Transthyretin-like family protein n=1 Tax=Cylicocyclus nassatus TaxID=53992 RepID=A0AA36HH31_CYLNA|nr:unnamed protein product [Cylicocyclus nassatus]
MTVCRTILLHLVLLIPLVENTFREQSVVVKGRVNCRGVQQPGTFVQLYDEDALPLFDSDDLLGSVTADDHGVFCVRGVTTEVTDIEPYIYIEHNCGYEGLDQKHFFIRSVPQEFVVEGNFSKKTYHMGDIELLTKDAPVQHYQRRMLIQPDESSEELSLHQQVMLCIPHYVAYKDYYEKVVVEGGTSVQNKTEVEKQAWDELMQRLSTPPAHLLPSGEGAYGETRTHTEERLDTYEHKEFYEERREGVPLGKEEEERERQEEQRRKEEEERIKEEQRREDERRMEEQQRLDELHRAEEQRRIEEERRLEEQRKLDEEKRLEEQRRLDEEKRFEEQKKMEEERRREEERKLDEERRLEEQRLEEQRKAEEQRWLDEEKALEEARMREDEEKKRSGEAAPKEHELPKLELPKEEEQIEREEDELVRQLKEEDERRKLEEEKRRLEEERILAEEKRLKEEEEFRREEDRRYEEQRRKEDEMRKEEDRIREEERRKEEELRREEIRRREEDYRREMEARREEHRRRLEEFKRLEEQRKLEIAKLEQERKTWMEKIRELEGQKRKHLVQVICSRDNVIRTTAIRQYTEGEDPCAGFTRT